MRIEKRNLVLWLLLTILTCGLASIVFYFLVYGDINKIDNSGRGKSPLLLMLLTIITCGIYGFYYAYVSGNIIDSQTNEENTGLIALILNLFTGGIFTLLFFQYKLNKLA